MRNDPSKAHFEEDSISYNPYSHPRSINALTKNYKFGHYRSFFKVNKNTFFSIAYNLSMEHQNEMKPKGLIRGHLKVSKKFKNTSKSSKLKKLCIVEVEHFFQICQKSTILKTPIFDKRAHFFSLDLILSHHTRFLSSVSCPFINISILFNFY